MNTKTICDTDPNLPMIEALAARKRGTEKLLADIRRQTSDDLFSDLQQGHAALQFLETSIRDLEAMKQSDLTPFEANFMRRAREIVK